MRKGGKHALVALLVCIWILAVTNALFVQQELMDLMKMHSKLEAAYYVMQDNSQYKDKSIAQHVGLGHVLELAHLNAKTVHQTLMTSSVQTMSMQACTQ